MGIAPGPHEAFDLQNLIKSSVGAGEYSLSGFIKIVQAIREILTRRTNKRSMEQPENITLLPTRSGGDSRKRLTASSACQRTSELTLLESNIVQRQQQPSLPSVRAAASTAWQTSQTPTEASNTNKVYTNYNFHSLFYQTIFCSYFR